MIGLLLKNCKYMKNIFRITVLLLLIAIAYSCSDEKQKGSSI